NKLWRIDVLQSAVPQWIRTVEKIVRQRFYLWRGIVREVAFAASILVIADAPYLEPQGQDISCLLLLDIRVRRFPGYGACHQIVSAPIKSSISRVIRAWRILGMDPSSEQTTDNESKVHVVGRHLVT